MLSFAGGLSPDSDAFVIFVAEKYDYKDKKNLLSNNEVQKSYLMILILTISPLEFKRRTVEVSEASSVYTTLYFPTKNQSL